MKRYISIVLSLIMLLSFTGCQPSNVDISQENLSTVQQDTKEPEHSIEGDVKPGCVSDSNPTTLPEGSRFEVHYIDVGQADSALIFCDDKVMLLDGGNASDSSLIYTYLKNRNVSQIDYLICSHPHEDHIGGLPAALSNFGVKSVYAPSITADSSVYNKFIQKVSQKGLTIQEPACGSGFKFGSSDVVFYGPVYATNEPNNSSVVLKITYGKTSFLFTGDAEREEEQDILSKGYNLSATVLKVGHHGSGNSTSYPFLREIMPKYAVISVGKNNSYNHPSEDALSRLRDADVQVFRTDMQGDIIAVSDGETVSFTTQKNFNAEANPTVIPKEPEQESSSISYIGNRNSKKFHLPSCRSLPAEHNRVYFNSRTEAVNSNYSPCGNCHP